jgi:hypothetical protein
MNVASSTSNSRCQLIHFIIHGLAELAHFLSVRPLVKRSADVSAKYPEFDTIWFINHRVLAMRESGANLLQKSRRRTLIVARRMLTELKTVLMGVILEVSSASVKASMATFNAEVAPSRSIGCWGFASVVGTGGRWEKA